MLISGFTLLQGCATTTGHVQLKYVPKQYTTGIEQAQATTVAVLFKNVMDRRPAQSVASKRNMLGMEMASFEADNEPIAVIQGAIGTELANSGYRMVERMEQAQAVIVVKLVKLWAEFQPGVWSVSVTGVGHINVTVRNSQSEAVTFNATVAGAGHRKAGGYAGEKDYEIALNKAIQDMVFKLFDNKEFHSAIMSCGGEGDPVVQEKQDWIAEP